MPGVLLLLTLVAWPAMAQDAPPAPGEGGGPPDPELQHAMQQDFENQLRLELALSDAEMKQITPHIERLEQARADARKERMRTMRELRRGLQEGAGDVTLQTLLDRLDAVEEQQRSAESSELGEIDAMLTVRQRVQLRFFIQRFRQELQRRVQGPRRGRFGEPGGPPMPEPPPPPPPEPHP